MISFEKSKAVTQSQYLIQTVADNMMRPVSRHFDEMEGEIPWDYIEFMHGALKSMGSASLVPAPEKKKEEEQEKEKKPRQAYVVMAHQIEMLSWGDAGFYLCTPRGGLGSAAVEAAGTPEQKEKFLSILNGDKPVFTAMAITEADAGSDNSAISARAVLDKETNEWVLNGEKIFVTAGHKAMIDTEGYTVVWATLDPAAGRAGIRSFVVPAKTPGVKVTKKEIKLGIRSSDTVTIVLDDVRVPYDHILGNPEVEKTTKGFKGAMQTFNVTRPLVAASALGVARGALEETKRLLKENGVEPRIGIPRSKMTYIERELVDMERMLRSCWLLTIKAVWMSDQRKPNALESAMSKLYAGDVVTKITQKAVEILGPLGYSREYLLEKWMRDAKINDIYEGTGQINRLIAARQLLGYRGSDLR
ncbi:MAG: acyl-CoA dehydrogenase family protein [Thermoleophilia bacterium]|nr:acyl-CoA dehydrogenase family protein [Thermoleophilia bacterium]